MGKMFDSTFTSYKELQEYLDSFQFRLHQIGAVLKILFYEINSKEANKLFLISNFCDVSF